MLVTCLAIAFVALAPVAHAGTATGPLQITYVYSQQCLSCEHARPAVEKAIADAPATAKVSRLDINTREGAEYARAHGIVSIPAVVINCAPPILFEDYGSVESYESALRERIACEAGTGHCDAAKSPGCTEKKMTDISVPAAFLAGLIAGINPCLLAVMAFIASTTLAATGSGTALVMRVVSFCGGLLAVYLLIGIGLMELLRLVPALDFVLKGAIVVALAAMAAWSFYDAWRAGRGVESRSFKTILGRMRASYENYALPASFAIGAAFGLVKMPCVGGLYIAILGTVIQSDRFAEGLVYLVFYNLGVIVPVLVLGGLLAYGLTPAALNTFRLRHRIKLKLFTGLLLAAMAAGFALGVI
ncbi:MAG TPA: cytochrome c biogenesis CcdA family protein [Methanocella sp.]